MHFLWTLSRDIQNVKVHLTHFFLHIILVETAGQQVKAIFKPDTYVVYFFFFYIFHELQRILDVNTACLLHRLLTEKEKPEVLTMMNVVQEDCLFVAK